MVSVVEVGERGDGGGGVEATGKFERDKSQLMMEDKRIKYK